MNRLHALVLSAVITLCSGTAVLAKEVQVKGYTKKDGTVVKGYTKTVKEKDEKSETKADSKPATTTETVKTETKTKDSKGNETVEVKGYTKKDGTKVEGYTRKKAAKKEK